MPDALSSAPCTERGGESRLATSRMTSVEIPLLPLDTAHTFWSGVARPSMEATKLSKWGSRPSAFRRSLIQSAVWLSASLPATRLVKPSASVRTSARARWPSNDSGWSSSGGTCVGLSAKNAVSASTTATSQVTR